jgi:hypothetical protein
LSNVSFGGNALSPRCIADLDAALADLIPKLKATDLPALRIEMLANNEIVMKEMERRGQPSKI